MMSPAMSICADSMSGGTPQQVYSMAVNHTTSAKWFFEVNAQWFGDNWFELAPTPVRKCRDCGSSAPLRKSTYRSEKEIAHQEKLNTRMGDEPLHRKGDLYQSSVPSISASPSATFSTTRNIRPADGRRVNSIIPTTMMKKYPSKIYYAQGIRVFFNVGIRF